MLKRINKKNKLLCEYVHDLILEIRKPTYMVPFKNPVDPVEVPNYYSVIKNPMDLSTMLQKLLDNQYQNLSAVKEDFELIIRNCEAFNPENSWIRQNSDKFKTNLDKAWRKLLETLKKKEIDPNKNLEIFPSLDNPNQNDLQFLISQQENPGLKTRFHSKDSVNESMEILKENSHKNSFYKGVSFPNEAQQQESNGTKIIIEKNFLNIQENPDSLMKMEPSVEDINQKNELRVQIRPENQAINKINNKDNDDNDNYNNNNSNHINGNNNANTNDDNNFALAPNLKLEEETKIKMEEDSLELKITINIPKIKREFTEYRDHKLKKYKKIIQKTNNKLINVLNGMNLEHTQKENDQVLDNEAHNQLMALLSELEKHRNLSYINVNETIFSQIKILFWLKKTHSKIKETKAIRRLLAYISSIMKSLKRAKSLIKRSKTLIIPTSEQLFLFEEDGIAYFRENFDKIKLLYNPPVLKTQERNSIKITLPKFQEKQEEIPVSTSINSVKISKKFSEKSNVPDYSSTKIVINKHMSKIKSLKQENEVNENKVDKLFSWACNLNKKIKEKNDNYLNNRLASIFNQNDQDTKKEEINQNIFLESENVFDIQKDSHIKYYENSIPFEFELKFPQKKIIENCKVFKMEEEEEEKAQNYQKPYISFDFFFNNNNNSNIKTNKSQLESKEVKEVKEEKEKPEENEKEIRNIIKFDEIFINKRVKTYASFIKPLKEQTIKIIVDEIAIFSLFKEIEEDDKVFFDELVRKYKKINERLKSAKNDKIVDKPNKNLFEISQEISLDKMIKISIKIYNLDSFVIEIQNRLKIKSYELFVNLKNVQKICELSLVENANWYTEEILSKKLMMNMLYDALLNQLIKSSKFMIDQESGIYFSVEKIANEPHGCILTIWTIIKQLSELSLSINGNKLL